jgi:hypothetical protein
MAAQARNYLVSNNCPFRMRGYGRTAALLVAAIALLLTPPHALRCIPPHTPKRGSYDSPDTKR